MSSTGGLRHADVTARGRSRIRSMGGHAKQHPIANVHPLDEGTARSIHGARQPRSRLSQD